MVRVPKGMHYSRVVGARFLFLFLLFLRLCRFHFLLQNLRSGLNKSQGLRSLLQSLLDSVCVESTNFEVSVFIYVTEKFLR